MPSRFQIAVSGQIRLAKIWSAHVIEGVVIVDYLEDFQRSPVQVSNQVYLSPTPVKISVPVYAPPVTYNSSGQCRQIQQITSVLLKL